MTETNNYSEYFSKMGVGVIMEETVGNYNFEKDRTQTDYAVIEEKFFDKSLFYIGLEKGMEFPSQNKTSR